MILFVTCRKINRRLNLFGKNLFTSFPRLYIRIDTKITSVRLSNRQTTYNIFIIVIVVVIVIINPIIP